MYIQGVICRFLSGEIALPSVCLPVSSTLLSSKREITSKFASQKVESSRSVGIKAENALWLDCANFDALYLQDSFLIAATPMPADVFFDTNVLIYSIVQGDPRSERADALLAAGGMISVQGLNEFVSVARRKIGMPWNEVAEALDAILVLCPAPVPITFATHQSALELAERYGFGIYDGLVLAAALQSRCRILYSEDLQDGQLIEERLTIRNPFR